MTEDNYALADVVARLTESGDKGPASHRYSEEAPMPSVDVLSKIVEDLRCVLFPGYYGPSEITPDTMPYYIGSTLDRLTRELADQINRGYCFVCDSMDKARCADCEERAKQTAHAFVTRLPGIRKLLLTDVEAAYDGDPAAKTHGETIFCYPSIRALTNHRVAHELYLLGVDIIPRPIPTRASTSTPVPPSANRSSLTMEPGPSSEKRQSSVTTSASTRASHLAQKASPKAKMSDSSRGCHVTPSSKTTSSSMPDRPFLAG